MAPRRRYTAKQRANAVGIAVVDGVTAAERKTGIPKTTIDYWSHRPDFVQLRTKSRDEVGEQMWAVIQVGVREVLKGLEQEAPLRDKATALGILYDKHALLTGGATGRTESRDLTGTLADGDLISAVHEAEQIAGDRGAETADQEPSAG